MVTKNRSVPVSLTALSPKICESAYSTPLRQADGKATFWPRMTSAEFRSFPDRHPFPRLPVRRSARQGLRTYLCYVIGSLVVEQKPDRQRLFLKDCQALIRNLTSTPYGQNEVDRRLIDFKPFVEKVHPVAICRCFPMFPSYIHTQETYYRYSKRTE